MFKILFSFLFLSTSLSASAWDTYRELKSNKFESVSLTVKNHLDIAFLAQESLKRDDIAAWNYNNAAYVLIQEFKRATDYDKMNESIYLANNAKDRKVRRNDLRISLESQWWTLTEAQRYLNEAIKLGYDADKQAFKDVKMGKRIDSNMEFIKWVAKFVDQTEE